MQMIHFKSPKIPRADAPRRSPSRKERVKKRYLRCASAGTTGPAHTKHSTLRRRRLLRYRSTPPKPQTHKQPRLQTPLRRSVRPVHALSSATLSCAHRRRQASEQTPAARRLRLAGPCQALPAYLHLRLRSAHPKPEQLCRLYCEGGASQLSYEMPEVDSVSGGFHTCRRPNTLALVEI